MSTSELKENQYPTKFDVVERSFLNTDDSDSWPLLLTKKEDHKLLTVDCEMVETKAGYELARATVIDSEYNEVLNRYVKPENPVINYHFKYSGIKPEHIEGEGVLSIQQLHKELKQIFDRDTILAGHSLENDLKALKVKTTILTAIACASQGDRYQPPI